jgi:hypothetical protein
MIVDTDFYPVAVINLFSGLYKSASKVEIKWNDGHVTTVEEEQNIQDEIIRIESEYDNAQYARDRAVAYPPMADQLDDIFHNGVAGWKKTIQAVKDTYPKP